MKKSETTQIPIDKLGPPGLPGELVVAPIYKNDEPAAYARIRDTEARSFLVKALLGKHASTSTELTAHLDKEKGSSYLMAEPEATVTKLTTPTGKLELLHNKHRELSLIEFRCEATNTNEARNKFLMEVTPFIDEMSYDANIPIHIAQINCTDETHNIQSIQYIGPHSRKMLNTHAQYIHGELMPIYALYREAKNSASLFYKFLCYYKILEGIYKFLRPGIFARAKKKGVTLNRRKEIVPSIDSLLTEYQELIGKPIKELFDKRFTPHFRNKVAHYLVEGEGPLNVSENNNSKVYGNELVLIESCVSVVIKTQREYLDQLSNESV